MTSIKLTVTGAHAWASVTGPLTSGMVGIPVTIEYDEAWDGLTKNLMCRCSSWGSDSGESRAILNVGEMAIVAHEVMQPDRYLYLGIEGFSGDGHLVMPTIWASCGKIEYGANTCEDPSTDPELSVWNQLQTEMEQLKEYTLSQDQVDEVQACAQEAALAAQEAKQAADEAKQAASVGGSGLYYTPVVTQPTGDTLRFEFKPSVTGAPIPRPVIVELPVGEASDGNGDLSAVLMTVPDNNLIDDAALVTEFVDSAGAAVTGNYSNYIPVKAGRRYVTNVVPSRFDWFDKDKNHLKTEFRSPNPSILIPEQSGYLLVLLAANHSSSLVLKGTDIGAYRPAHRRLRSEYVRDAWFGKRMLSIGDSVTTDEDVYASDGYAKLISRELGMELTNVAISGKTVAWGYEVLDECDDQFDLITVMLGTNDQGYNMGIGALNDEHYAAGEYDSTASFYARMQLLVEKLRQKFPRSLILMLTPIKRTAVGEGASNDAEGYYTNSQGLTTKAYRDVVIDVCNYYSIPCVDLYNTIDPRTEADRELYFMSAADGTHPNDLGHALKLAPVIKDAILRHTPYVFPEWDDPGEDAATYTITNTLTNVTNSNSAASVAAGASYAATLTAAEGYVLGAVSVTMGGEDITDTAYTGGSITIGAVTGNVVITATATADDSGGGDPGDTTEAVLIHAYGLGVQGQSIEDTVGDCDMTASGELHGVHCSEGTWNLDRGASFSLRSKATRNTTYYRVSHQMHTGARGGSHVTTGNAYNLTGRFWFGLGAPAGVTATNGDSVVSFWYYTAHDSTATSEVRYGSKVVAAGDSVELALTFDADTSTVRIYQDGELTIEEVTSVPLAVDGLVVYGNWASELPAGAQLGASPCEYIEMYRGVVEV